MEEKHQVLTEKQQIESRIDGVQQAKQQAQLNQEGAPAPPSTSSSPSHEFSFTISLDIPPDNKNNKSSPSPPPFAAVDLSPADEIFFHGHLLPLHLLSQLPTSPRASMDSFTLPIKELLQENNSNNDCNNNNKSSSTRSTSDEDDEDDQHESRHVLEGKNRGKSKSFSLFGNMPKWKKLGFDSKEDFDDNQQQKLKSNSKSKSRFEFLKRYMGLILPFLSNRGRGDSEFRRRRYSYSGNLRFRSKKDLRGRRGEFSAPATMKTSPANSGILLTASGTVTPTNKSDSTMEELQAAIQAAIAHCKKSIATEDQNQGAMKL